VIDLAAARQLLDFTARIGDIPLARQQLEGAVAVHNLLERHRVAYCADEVGMGKTFVALGAIALFRNMNPDFRVLVIAPRENLQHKWIKELQGFVERNVRFSDLRIRAVDGTPVRSQVLAENLVELTGEAALDPNRDFFARLSSFSLAGAATDRATADRLRGALLKIAPWIDREVFDFRNKLEFKDSVAKAICCVLPEFDLVVVDEGHNLKHGFAEDVAARNRVLALAFGHPKAEVDRRRFPNYGPRAKRVLFLSATPVEESYRQLWNQLDIFGLGSRFPQLAAKDASDDAKKRAVSEFLIRRVTTMKAGDREYTKNLYRREWRQGGVAVHDAPLAVTDPRQRLCVALVQKKVAEILGSDRFKSSFQIGMLASFESFLETAGLRQQGEDDATFDDAEQTETAAERKGIDVDDVNRIARSHRERFHREMPHPKMDALVEALAGAWRTGKKALVFVRRVASVSEIKRKLDERYDQWLIDRLRGELPPAVIDRLDGLFTKYQREREAAVESRTDERPPGGRLDGERDHGGTDSFFAWFFRGEGPAAVVSGANVQQRFVQRGAVYSTFFADNHVADVLGCAPGQVLDTLAKLVHRDRDQVRGEIRRRSARFLSRVKKFQRADRLEAVQAAAIEWLKEIEGPHREAAQIAWSELFASSQRDVHAAVAPDIGDWLEVRTFFTELRRRTELRAAIWPAPTATNACAAFRERELRAQLLAATARLGNAFIDLYVMTIRRLGSLELGAQEAVDDDGDALGTGRIEEYLALLDAQRSSAAAGPWRAFHELSEVALHFDLILDVNDPEARRRRPLVDSAREFGRLLGRQQPVAGMFSQVNRTAVRQFRMPGYPLVLITTDLLQEGEDLHTFCSAIHHYGISWTPSAMEQRTGRIDRARSQTERRLGQVRGELDGEDMLQVHFPHLRDTVEVFQVRRVLQRMNTFLRLMHEGLTTAPDESRSIDTDREFVTDQRDVPKILEPLRTAFPVRPSDLRGDVRAPAVGQELAAALLARFERIPTMELPGLTVTWDSGTARGTLLGTARLGSRVQPFRLRLFSYGTRAVVRCTSRIGPIAPERLREFASDVSTLAIRVAAIADEDQCTVDASIDEVLTLPDAADHDAQRIAWVVRRVAEAADCLEKAHVPGQDEDMTALRRREAGETNHAE